MNYRHHFHAGNFADVMKHAILLALCEAAATAAGGAARVLETHAGAGLYDLTGAMAARSGEAERGVARLMADAAPPAALDHLKAAVAAENPGGSLRVYPGSPILAVQALGPAGRYVGCELRPDDFDALTAALAARRRPGAATATARLADGYAALPELLAAGDLVVIDPPYEQGDDYDRVAEAAALCIARGAGAAIWAPIKDLETLDGLVRRLEAHRPRRLAVAEVRLRPLTNPMAMNGSALVMVDAPAVDAAAAAVCDWVAVHCGEPGAMGGLRRVVG